MNYFESVYTHNPTAYSQRGNSYYLSKSPTFLIALGLTTMILRTNLKGLYHQIHLNKAALGYKWSMAQNYCSVKTLFTSTIELVIAARCYECAWGMEKQCSIWTMALWLAMTTSKLGPGIHALLLEGRDKAHTIPSPSMLLIFTGRSQSLPLSTRVLVILHRTTHTFKPYTKTISYLVQK